MLLLLLIGGGPLRRSAFLLLFSLLLDLLCPYLSTLFHFRYLLRCRHGLRLCRLLFRLLLNSLLVWIAWNRVNILIKVYIVERVVVDTKCIVLDAGEQDELLLVSDPEVCHGFGWHCKAI